MNTAQTAREYGGSLVIVLKLLMAAAFIGLAFIDRNTTFLTKNPGKVIGEAVLVGAMATLAFVLLAINRRVNLVSLKWTFISVFVVFFGVHFLFELSGFNEIQETTGSRKLGRFEERGKRSILARIFIFFIMFLLLSFTLCGWDTPEKKWNGWRVRGAPGFIGEGLVFAILNAVPFIMIHKDRGGSTSDAMIEFIKFIFIFFLGHLGAQYGGLYNETGLMGPTSSIGVESWDPVE
jgi:hypothetical protein